MTPSKAFDVVVIGGGPAGLMAAYNAALRGLSTVVVDTFGQPPKKLLITGKGRCNVCNNCEPEVFFENVVRGGRFLNSSYRAFDAADIMEFFESRGVPLMTERGARVYPKSETAADIAAALVEAAKDAGAKFLIGEAEAITAGEASVEAVVLKNKQKLRCRAAVIATGGMSYPKTGSDGAGYRMAKQLGHTISNPRGALVAIACSGGDCAEMMGLSLRNVTLCARQNGGKLLFSQLGELLFTHFGVSGPLVLSLSSVLADCDYADISAEIDVKPGLDAAALDARILRDFKQNLNRDFKNSLDALLPQSMIPVVIRKSGIDPLKKVHSITAAERARLVQNIKHFALELVRPRPVAEAVVTAGGVKTDEIDPKTMMSKKMANLHFAGEVMDADALTGGFNLMIAFATGAAAGRHVLAS